MPLQAIPALEAWKILRRNKTEGFWPGRSAEANRLEPICMPGFRPTFKLRPSENVFTIGSCFARNIENQLARLGYQIPSREYVPEELVGKPLDGFMNKFTPQSMLNEVRWALTPERAPTPEGALLPQEDGTVIDGQLMSKINVSPARGLQRRQEITNVFKGIVDCRVVILTLGLVEAWYDKKYDLYLNRTLPEYNSKQEPDRFEFRVLSFDELYAATRELIDTIITKGHPETRILLSVSPVPLTATFTDNDVLCSNMYSKSVLRTVAEHIVTEFSAVDYFPSYESVMLSDRMSTRKDDLIHVRDEIVAVNVGRMAEAYTPSSQHAEMAKKIGKPTVFAPAAAPRPSKSSFKSVVEPLRPVARLLPRQVKVALRKAYTKMAS